jgi:hypothetical protein
MYNVTVENGDEPSTTHTSETKKTSKKHKQKQSLENKNEQPENAEDKVLSDAESISSNDSGDLQESPRNMSATTPRDKTTIADHKAVDILCDSLTEKGNHPVPPTTFSQFLKACRRQKDPRTIAKEYTTNITGLVNMLEENLFNTKDYNLRRIMKRIIDSLKV